MRERIESAVSCLIVGRREARHARERFSPGPPAGYGVLQEVLRHDLGDLLPSIREALRSVLGLLDERRVTGELRFTELVDEVRPMYEEPIGCARPTTYQWARASRKISSRAISRNRKD